VSARARGAPAGDPRAAPRVEFTVNGRSVAVDRHPMARLLDVLREDLGLTGTKEGCGEGECGACTVLLDGEPVCSCLVPLAHVRGRDVLTIEGLGSDHPLQRAFAEEGGAQCGACTPGMILAALALPARASRGRIREGLAGNLCRCTGYEAIYRAVEKAAVGRQPSAAGDEVGP
jgi:carbon-monoxide dehydrogenase small subunit/xanthine dehydrogenase small subunit